MANLQYYQDFVENDFGGDEDEFCAGERLDPIDEDTLEQWSKKRGLYVDWTGRGYLFRQIKSGNY